MFGGGQGKCKCRTMGKYHLRLSAGKRSGSLGWNFTMGREYVVPLRRGRDSEYLPGSISVA